MNFDRATRAKLTLHVVTSFDPTGATVELAVDDTWHPATWQGNPAPNPAGTEWSQQALTDGYFAGPDAPADSATVLATGRHTTRLRVTKGTQVITVDASVIDVA